MFVGQEGARGIGIEETGEETGGGTGGGRQGGTGDRGQWVRGTRRGLPLEHVEVENVGTCCCVSLPLEIEEEEVKGDGAGT
jgi:hypothetical protein